MEPQTSDNSSNEAKEYNVKLSDGSSYKIKSTGGIPSEQQILDSLKSMGHLNINDSKTVLGDKSITDNAVESPTSHPEASTSEAKARSDSDSIGASKVVSKGNLEANGAPGQTNIIESKEHESLLSKGWKLITDAASSPTGKMLLTGSNDELDKLKQSSGITDTKGPGLMEIPGLHNIAEDIRNKGRNSGDYLKGFGSSVLGDIIDAASSGFDPRTAGLKEPLELPENTPVFKGSEPTRAIDQFPEKEDALEHRPDLVPVGDEKSFNDGRTNVPLNEEDRLLDLVKNKQGMGKELPSSDLMKNESTKPTATYKGEQPTGIGDETMPIYDVKGGPLDRSTVSADTLRKNGIDVPESNDINKKSLADLVRGKRGIERKEIINNHWKDVKDSANNLKSISNDVINNQEKASADLFDISGLPKESKLSLTEGNNSLTPPTTSGVPQFNRRGMTGETGTIQNKPRLLLNSDGSFINKETGEMYDMRGHQIDELDKSRPASLIDTTDQMNNKELSHNGGGNEPPSYDPLDPHADEPNEPNKEDPRKLSLSDIINFPKSMKTIWHVGAAPFRQGAGLISTKPWWTAWNDLFEGLKGEEAFKATQKAINNRPLFKSYGGEPSFAQKIGLKLTDLGNLANREEDNMSRLADMIPGVRMTQRGYTAYLNKLRADSLESLLSKFKVLGEDGEYNIPLAKEIAEYINNATGRGSLRTNPTLEGITGNLEKNAVALNNAFFSPRFIASRLSILSNSAKAVFTPSTYMFSQPSIRREYLRSLLSIAGIGATLGELAHQSGIATVEHDPTSSDFGKIKVGNTRIDPYAGMQQPIVLATRLLTGNETSSSSGKSHNIYNAKPLQDNAADVLGKFARSKESPALSFAHSMAVGRRPDGTKFDLPEDVVNMFVPLILQDLKEVATDNPNLIPNYHEDGLGFENATLGKGMLAIPGAMGMGEQNYKSKKDN